MEIIKVNLVRVIRVVMEFITVINTMFVYTLQEKNALSLLITSHCNQYLQGHESGYKIERIVTKRRQKYISVEI